MPNLSSLQNGQMELLKCLQFVPSIQECPTFQSSFSTQITLSKSNKIRQLITLPK